MLDILVQYLQRLALATTPWQLAIAASVAALVVATVSADQLIYNEYQVRSTNVISSCAPLTPRPDSVHYKTRGQWPYKSCEQ